VADVLDVVLPVLYMMVAGLGVAMLFDRNPLARLGTGQAPSLRSANGTAFLYGVFLAPMTLPCTGPIVVSAFVIGGVGGTGALIDSLTYFLWFSLGFGWPLVLLPFLALPAQRRITSVLARNHRRVTVASGLLLLGIAAFGWWTELGPGST
jgi:cytochrome c-type biogenesis protein